MASKQDRASAFKFIVALGFVSLFADMTYEGAHSVIGPLLKDLGASAAQVGFIAGLGEMIAASLRFFSGRFADRTRAYWTITTLGYFLNLVVVPALAFTGSWQVAALLIVAERTGKSLRGPARDVLLSEATGGSWPRIGLWDPCRDGPDRRGPGTAAGGGIGGAVAQFWPRIPVARGAGGWRFCRADFCARGAAEQRRSPAAAKRTRAAEGLLVLRGGGRLARARLCRLPLLAFHFQKSALIKPEVIPLLYAGAMGVNGLTALVFGRLFDRYGIQILVFGILVSLLALPFGFLGGEVGVFVSVACWATGLGAQDATLRSGISQVVSMKKRGSAFGAFNGIYGVMWFLGSVAMGLLYDHSLIALVVLGVAAQLVAASVFVWLRRPLAEAIAAR